MSSETQLSPDPGIVSLDSSGSDRNWHVAFGLIGAVAFGWFGYWAWGYVDSGASRFVLVLAIAFGLFMAFNIGGNDVANSFGTSVGAGTLSMKQALIVAAIFEVSGAVIAGGEVTETVRSGIVDLEVVGSSAADFMYIMMAALLAAAVWLLVATRMGWPVSTTHSIIGGIVGAALLVGWNTVGSAGALSMVHWDQIGLIAMSWVLSPLLGGLVAYLVFGAIKRNILVYNDRADEALAEVKVRRKEHRDRHLQAFERLSEIQKLSYTSALARDAVAANRDDVDPDEFESDYFRELREIDATTSEIDAHRALVNWVPLFAAAGGTLISGMLLTKGLKNLHLNLSTANQFLIMLMVGAGIWLATYIFARTLRNQSLSRSTFLMFSWMQVFTACGFAFSHGSNDIANAIGPFAAILDVLKTGAVSDEASVPPAAMLTFGVALVVGLWFVGRRVIQTVGENLTQLHPASGFSAELSAAAVVMGASVLGLPVSSTHILIGAVLGVGMVNRSTNWKLMKPIALAWVITLPAAALIGAFAVQILRSAL